MRGEQRRAEEEENKKSVEALRHEHAHRRADALHALQCIWEPECACKQLLADSRETERSLQSSMIMMGGMPIQHMHVLDLQLEMMGPEGRGSMRLFKRAWGSAADWRAWRSAVDWTNGLSWEGELGGTGRDEHLHRRVRRKGGSSGQGR